MTVKYSHRKLPLKLQALVVLLLGCVLATSGLATELPRTTVAVMAFAVDGPAFADGQGLVMGELLTGELLATGKYTVVERIQLDKAAQELSLQAGGQIDPATAVALGQRVGAQVVVVGILSGDDNDKMASGRFVDVGKGTVLVAKNLPVASGSLLNSAQKMVAALVAAEEKTAKGMQEKARRLAALGQTDAAQELYKELATRFSRTSVAPDAVVQQARFYLKEGGYFDAADGAESLLETYPDHALAEEGLFILAESKFFTVYGDPDRTTDPRAFLESWQKSQAAQPGEALDSLRLKARLNQEAKQKYELLLAEFPATKHAPLVKERLAVINRHGGQ